LTPVGCDSVLVFAGGEGLEILATLTDADSEVTSATTGFTVLTALAETVAFAATLGAADLTD
jgi:hypothetical protein